MLEDEFAPPKLELIDVIGFPSDSARMLSESAQGVRPDGIEL